MATTAPAVPATARRLASPTLRSQLDALPGTIRLGRAGARLGERRTRRVAASAEEGAGETTKASTRARTDPRNARMRDRLARFRGLRPAGRVRPLCPRAARN